jgi:hypothetical protein
MVKPAMASGPKKDLQVITSVSLLYTHLLPGPRPGGLHLEVWDSFYPVGAWCLDPHYMCQKSNMQNLKWEG